MGKVGLLAGPYSNRPPSPSTIESLLADLFLYDETEVKEFAVEAFSSLEELFGEEKVQKAKGRMSYITPFDMAIMVVVPLPSPLRYGCHGSSPLA